MIDVLSSELVALRKCGLSHNTMGKRFHPLVFGGIGVSQHGRDEIVINRRIVGGCRIL